MSPADPRYGAEVRRRMASLAGAGEWPATADVVTSTAGDREQGAEVVLSMRVAAGQVCELRFRAFGCPHFLASSSWLTDRLRGAGRDELANWDWRDAADVLEVPPAKFGRLLVLQDAVHGLAKNWLGATGSSM